MSATQRQYSPECLAKIRDNCGRARMALELSRERRREVDASDLPYPRGTVISADFERVKIFADRWGILFTCWDELPRVNAVRDRENLLPFKRQFPVKGRFG